MYPQHTEHIICCMEKLEFDFWQQMKGEEGGFCRSGMISYQADCNEL